jgi:hypothetical protein
MHHEANVQTGNMVIVKNFKMSHQNITLRISFKTVGEAYIYKTLQVC